MSLALTASMLAAIFDTETAYMVVKVKMAALVLWRNNVIAQIFRYC